ncbi:Pentatricopeptide repeat-containing protein, mitochondrial [Sesamum angolense]|uniref:Pentatricopeptide repeat-containing protein, mitochondrial n=1 Tax=Sesamum angolense TaxID=2727404 RepID=A0AAE1VZL7_9LAMI|nr:Pentatricopeptide repeat-containing protein, mitochondrial [Sesamum angolense]
MCDAIKQFRLMPVRNVVSWTAIISGFVEKGDSASALGVLKDIRKTGGDQGDEQLHNLKFACSLCKSFYASLIKTYSKLGAIDLSEIAFAESQDLKQAVRFSRCSKCGGLEQSLKAFEQLERKDNVSWTSMIVSLGEHGCADKDLPKGSSAFLRDASACKVFQQMKYPDLVRKTTMITSYANHGKGLEALQLFDLMEKSGTEPNDVTFVGVRSACSHTGLVGEGYFHLNSMIKDYGIESGYKHYKALWWIFLAVRAGRLEEAQRLKQESGNMF